MEEPFFAPCAPWASAMRRQNRKYIFNRVMLERLEKAVAEDGAGAIMFGSTTMALTGEMRAAAGGVPLFMPGMVALGVMEQLWHGGLWPGQGTIRSTI